jgi:molybdate transport system substrate-binding protein
VFAAASLTGASPVLEKAFEDANPGNDVQFHLDGTQMLSQKIQQGAEADVFLSASSKYTEELKAKGYLDNATVKKIAGNYIIIILPAVNPANITTLADLSRPGLRIAMGTPEVPVGINTRQTIDLLANASLGPAWKDGVFKNVVTYETTEPGIVTKVNLAEVDAGFVYESSYKASKPGSLNALEIPAPQNTLQTYTIGVPNQAKNQDGARKFVSFMASPEGQAVLAEFGFRAP